MLMTQKHGDGMELRRLLESTPCSRKK